MYTLLLVLNGTETIVESLIIVNTKNGLRTLCSVEKDKANCRNTNKVSRVTLKVPAGLFLAAVIHPMVSQRSYKILS